MQDWYDLPKDSTAYPYYSRRQYYSIPYWQTSEFRRYFTKWFGSFYILLGIFMPLSWFLLYGFNTFDVIAMFMIEIDRLFRVK